MVINIGILGSCVSRDSFNSNFNKNYSQFFNVNLSLGRTSFISIMSKPIKFNPESIKINPDTKKNKFRTIVLKQDFEKSILKEICGCDIEYLIIDNYFEVIFGILQFGEGEIVTNNFWDLYETEFYKNINTKTQLQMFTNPKEYFDLWKICCDKFFEFINKARPDIKLILNPVRLSKHAIRKNRTIEKNRYKNKAEVFNQYISKLDEYIVKNYDVYLMDLQENTFADDTHLWGSGEVHFEKKFYHNFLENLKLIIIKDYYYNNKPNPFTDRKLSLKKIMLKMEKLEKENFILKNNLNKLKTYKNNPDIELDNSGKIILGNYIFQKPQNFIAPYLSENNSLRLINISQNITLFISVYGRFGDYCKEDFALLIENQKNNPHSNLITHEIRFINNIPVYNLIISKEDFFESVYLISKNNKTFRLTFKIEDKTVNTFNFVEKIYNSLTFN